MKHAGIIGLAVGCALLTATALGVQSQVDKAAVRLKTGEADKPKVAIANDADASYCTPAFKMVPENFPTVVKFNVTRPELWN